MTSSLSKHDSRQRLGRTVLVSYFLPARDSNLSLRGKNLSGECEVGMVSMEAVF